MLTPDVPTVADADTIVDREPVAIFLGGLAALIDVGLVAANAMEWVSLTDGQTASLVAFVTAFTALAGSMVRARVWSPASVASAVATIAPTEFA